MHLTQTTAHAHTSTDTQNAPTDFLEPLAAFAPGTQHAGFLVERIETIAELPGCAYIMRHQATGARLMWLACADENRAFSIAFKTPPADDTGVFHILEHSVLCGSKHFPVKEPFVNLLKTSMQTFLNALTFPDKTMYPVASTNEQDLMNLADVYLDAVLHPNILTRPRIFEQEGWHYELEDTNDGEKNLVYNGVVFNEMKGALSDPDEVLFEQLNRKLFPDTCYQYESGGDPKAIPSLSYEGFIDTWRRHYQLPNSYTVLYGNLDIERMLSFVSKRFDEADNSCLEGPNPLEMQAPLIPEPSCVTMQTAPENACVGLGYVVGTSHDRNRILAVDVLLDAIMGSNEAPLKRALLDAGLGDDIASYLMDGLAQPLVLIQLKGAHAGVANTFRELVETECARLVKEGIGRERLEASLAQAEFNLREGDFGYYPDGVALAMQALSSWLYDDNDATAYLHYEEAIAQMREHLDDGWFEALLQDIICESNHHAAVELIPTELDEEQNESKKLTAIAEEMGPEGLAAVADEVAALRAEQEAPDAPEALALLPQLGIDDIGKAPTEPSQHEETGHIAPCFVHDVPCRHVDYVYAYFGLDCVTWEDLPYVSVLCDLLGRLDTTSHTASELDTLVETNLGTLSFFVETYSCEDGTRAARPTLVVSTSALAERVEAAATILAEVWSQTVFTDRGRIRDILQQRRVAMEQAFTGSGHAAALSRISSYFSQAALVSEQVAGVDQYLFLKDLLAHFDGRFESLTAKLTQLAQTIFSQGNVEISFAGTSEELERFWSAAGTLHLSAQAGHGRLAIPEPEIRNEAFCVPSGVVFVGEGMDGYLSGCKPDGAWQLAGRALSYDYLWNEVRVKGGAYGCGFGVTNQGIARFYSFRDPGVDATVERFEKAASWLASWSPSESEFVGYVVSTVAGMDAPAKPRAIARRQDMERLSKRPDGWREQIRSEVLAATPADVQAHAEALQALPAKRGICVFGERALIEASRIPLVVRDLMGTEQ